MHGKIHIRLPDAVKRNMVFVCARVEIGVGGRRYKVSVNFVYRVLERPSGGVS